MGKAPVRNIGLRKPVAEFKPLIDCSVRTIKKHMGKNVQFLVLGRGGSSLHMALKKAGMDAKLISMSTAMAPTKFGRGMKAKVPDHVDFLSEKWGVSKRWLENNKLKQDLAAKEIMEENDYFQNDPVAKELMAHLEKVVDRNKRVVVLDTGFQGTLPAYLSHLLKKRGIDADWDIVLHNNSHEQLKPAFNSTKMLNMKTNNVFGKVKGIKEMPKFKNPKSLDAREYADLTEAISEEIASRIREKRKKDWLRFFLPGLSNV